MHRRIGAGTLRAVAAAISLIAALISASPTSGFKLRSPSIRLRGTVVTMDAVHTVIAHGNVLVRKGKIEQIWSDRSPPPGLDLTGVATIDAGADGLIFPGLINIHDHPDRDVLPTWLAPSSHSQPAAGRPLGTEPYANRYEWGAAGAVGPEAQLRLVKNSYDVLDRLGRLNDVLVHAEARAALGGQTAMQGGQSKAVNTVLVRNVDAKNFGRGGRILDYLTVRDEDFGSAANGIQQLMALGAIDAWLIHLAEGVRDTQLPAGAESSRSELTALGMSGVLTDATVVIHGTGLERTDFEAMRAAPQVLSDGLGAKLVWSPLSNLLLYGTTTEIYDALAEDLVVSLSTDWTPSGSNTLLDELKIADIALRDVRLLGDSRATVPALADEASLDRLLVDMVTRNPARSLHWNEVGTIAEGKVADLLLLRRPTKTPTNGMPDTPYRNLIDATARDVALVLVGGNPIAGDIEYMSSLRNRDFEVVSSSAGGFQKAIDVTGPNQADRLSKIESRLAAALEALGGTPSIKGTFYPYLRKRIDNGAYKDDGDVAFKAHLAARYGGSAGINLEAIEPKPIFADDDDFLFAILAGELTRAGLIDDPSPPYELYPANLNHIQAGGNPFAASAYFDRWYGSS